ncbi:MAG: DUF4157 domain-containing protein [Ilumatobacteraceae bacterium]
MAGPEHATREHWAAPPQAQRPIVQRRLTVGAVDDPLEREADEMADRLVASLDADGGPLGVPDDTGKDGGGVHPSPTGAVAAGAITRIRRMSTTASPAIGAEGGGLDQETETMLDSQLGRGRQLDGSTRAAMESGFGHDFGSVRIHDGGPSRELNRRMSAEAFTIGNDIFFAGSAPDASSPAGQNLLAHELTHVVQQGGGRVRRRAAHPDDPKRMSPGRNPKSDRPKGHKPHEGAELAGEQEMSEEEQEEIGRRVRRMIRRRRAAHDRVHLRKQHEVAKRKGVVGTTVSQAGRELGYAGNEAGHMGRNVGRAIGQLVGMSVKPRTTVRMAIGVNTTATASGAYGAVDTELIEPKFDVKLVNGNWQVILTQLKGTYGKITAPLPAGLAEVTGPDANDSQDQIEDLLALDGNDWYMSKAVKAHEGVHEGHIHDTLNNVGTDLAQRFAALTVPQAAAADAAAAKAAIIALPAYAALTNPGAPNNSQIRQIWDTEYVRLIDRDHYGPTQEAEADVVEPMINKINAWRKKNNLPKIPKVWTSLDGDDNPFVPPGR